MISSLILLQCGGKSTSTGNSAETDAGRVRDAAKDGSADVAVDDATARFDAASDVSSSAVDASEASAIDFGWIVDASGDWALPKSSGPTWRSSTAPYCNPSPQWAPNIWSDERGVFASTDKLMFNDGTGWSDVPGPTLGGPFTGVSHGGPLIFYTFPCGAVFFDGQNEQCVGTVRLDAVFAADAQHIYALAGNRILWFNGSYFVQYGGMLARSYLGTNDSIWATTDGVVVVAADGKTDVVDGPSAPPRELPLPEDDSGTPPWGWSLWGFARDDLWVGGTDGRLAHYDGSTWSIVQAMAPGPCSTITHLWGANHVLFFASSTTVGRWQGGTIDIVLGTTCVSPYSYVPGTYDVTNVLQIWGNSPTEVFFAIQEYQLTGEYRRNAGTDYWYTTTVARDACGLSHLYWFDGHAFGPL